MEADVGGLRNRRRVRVRASLWLALVGRLPATASHSRSIAMMMMILVCNYDDNHHDNDDDHNGDNDDDNDDHDDNDDQ